MGNFCPRFRKLSSVQPPSVQPQIEHPEKLIIRIPKQRQTYSHSLKSNKKTNKKIKIKNTKQKHKKMNTR